MISKRPSRFTVAELRWLCGVSPEQFADLVVRVGPRWEQQRLEGTVAFVGDASAGQGFWDEAPSILSADQAELRLVRRVPVPA